MWSVTIHYEGGEDEDAGETIQYVSLHDPEGRYVADIHGLNGETNDQIKDRAALILGKLNS